MIVKMKEVVRTHMNETHNRTAPHILYVLRDVFLNPDHVQMIRANEKMQKRLAEGQLRGVENSTTFSTISLTSSPTDIVVVGNVDEVRDKLMNGRSLLNG